MSDTAEKKPSPGKAPPVDFCTFILSLGSSAMIHLGEIENPERGDKAVNLPMAHQTIDMIAMLEEKTRGNRTTEEERYIMSLLKDLRLRYVEVCRDCEEGQTP